MNSILVQSTRYLLCLVSMLLTGLFALSFSSTAHLSVPFTIVGNEFLAPVFMVVVGMGIDLSKYLFWYYRHEAVLFLVISLLLVFFSWAASVAFFLSQEQGNLALIQKDTRAYQAHQAKIHRLQQTIAEKRLLVGKRLDSRYHTQWDKAADLMQEISWLEKQLAPLIPRSDTVGVTEAQQQLSTSAFFAGLAKLLDSSITVVATTTYGVLALLIELCALGSISLAQLVSKTSSARVFPHNAYQGTPAIENKQTNRKDRESSATTRPIKPEKKARLRADILNGTVAPIIRQIKRSGYGLSEENIRKILQELKAQGVLVDSGRHLRLTNPLNPESAHLRQESVDH